MNKLFTILIFSFISTVGTYAQTNVNRDSLVNALLNEQTTPGNDQGLQLIQNGNYAGANQFFSNAISNDESDRKAYFRRGVANWALSDTLNACRDWSAVLALGDTEMFNLLDSKCHGAMIISNDTIPAKQYKKMWGQKGSSETAAAPEAKTVVEVMPAYPGGDEKLFEYLFSGTKAATCKQHGTVYVNFLISPKGKILYPYVTRGIGKECDKEALKIIRNMPPWSPGKQKGKAVYVRSNLPVRF
jgi:hypothetical protein